MHVPSADLRIQRRCKFPVVTAFSTQKHERTLLRSLTAGLRHVKANKASRVCADFLSSEAEAHCLKAVAPAAPEPLLQEVRHYSSYYDYDTTTTTTTTTLLLRLLLLLPLLLPLLLLLLLLSTTTTAGATATTTRSKQLPAQGKHRTSCPILLGRG